MSSLWLHWLLLHLRLLLTPGSSFLDWQAPVRENKNTWSCSEGHSVMMALFWHCALLSCLVAILSAGKVLIKVLFLMVCLVQFEQKLHLKLSCLPDMQLDCRPDHMTLVWMDSKSQTDLSLFRLGSCFPTSVSKREVVFSVDFNDCSFGRLVSRIPWYLNCKTLVYCVWWPCFL